MKTINNVLLSGSYARGTNTANSDMDFIIISDNASSFHCESLYKETGEVQQIFFPKTKIHRMVLEKSYEYNGVVVSMLKSCVVLSDDDSFANRLTTYVDNMPHQRPGEEAVNSYLNMLRNNISYLKCADDKLEKDLIVSTIFVLLSHILAYNFITGTKHCIRILKGSPYYQPFLELMEDYKIKSDEPEQAIIGPNIIRVRFSLKRGQSLRPLLTHMEDISREMERSGVIVQPILNSSLLNLDIPRKTRETIYFSGIVDQLPVVTSPEQLFFTLGRTPDGKDLFCNLAEMPHLLVAGSTGSGKTVFLHTLLASLLKSHKTPNELQILLSSSGPEDFNMFNGLPHLIGGKVIDDVEEATEMIRTTVIQEFERRAEILTQAMVPNIIEYNKVSKDKLAPIVVLIDEFADLSDQLSTKQEKDAFFAPVKRIAQIGRKRGMHLVLCTQRPSATLVPSNIKSQITGRVALSVNDGNSSRMILEDSGDARYLLKYGDMIYKNVNITERAQGYFISPLEVAGLIKEIISYNK